MKRRSHIWIWCRKKPMSKWLKRKGKLFCGQRNKNILMKSFLKACVQHPLSFRGDRPSSLLSFLKACDSAYITGRLYVLKVLDQNMLPSIQCLFCRCLSIFAYRKDAADARSDLVCSLNSNSNFKIIFKPCWSLESSCCLSFGLSAFTFVSVTERNALLWLSDWLAHRTTTSFEKPFGCVCSMPWDIMHWYFKLLSNHVCRIWSNLSRV